MKAPQKIPGTRTIYETNYERIFPLLETEPEYLKLHSDGYMDLVIEKIGKDVYSMAHYYEQNGDLMRDPDMTVKVIDGYMVEALTYQQDNLGLYQEVYPEPGKYYPKLKTQLNDFLRMWLKNLKSQGFMEAARIERLRQSNISDYVSIFGKQV